MKLNLEFQIFKYQNLYKRGSLTIIKLWQMGKQHLWQFIYVQCNWAGPVVITHISHLIMRIKAAECQRATVYCYSMSSGLTGCGSGMIDFFSVSLDRAFLISAKRKKLNQDFFKPSFSLRRSGLCHKAKQTSPVGSQGEREDRGFVCNLQSLCGYVIKG